MIYHPSELQRTELFLDVRDLVNAGKTNLMSKQRCACVPKAFSVTKKRSKIKLCFLAEFIQSEPGAIKIGG